MRALLRALATGRDVAELGSAFGEGAAAMAETARSVVTVEHDAERVAVARERLAPFGNVRVLHGDWRELVDGTYGLVFADAGAYDWERIVELLEPGGIVVKDDLTPGRPIEGDAVREFLLRDPRLAGAEILTAPDAAAIVAVKR
ncbi:MAG TPA: hypothetical protein VJQ85_08380 [Gaiellaceae bacterium]|nr:hypothetical protein [Gaiellaceae bacterium]